MQKNPSENAYFTSILAHVNLTVAQGSIFKPWFDPLQDSRMHWMRCFQPGLLNKAMGRQGTCTKGKLFFHSLLYKEIHLYMDKASWKYMCFLLWTIGQKVSNQWHKTPSMLTSDETYKSHKVPVLTRLILLCPRLLFCLLATYLGLAARFVFHIDFLKILMKTVSGSAVCL